MGLPKFVRGIGINLIFEALSSVISSLYQEFKEKKGLVVKINQHKIYDKKTGVGGTIGELTQNYRLETVINDVIDYFREKIAYASQLTNSLYARGSDANSYVIIQKAQDSLPNSPPKLRKITYFSDIDGEIGDTKRKLERFYDLVKDLYINRFGLLYRITAERLIRRIREQKGVPVLDLEHILLRPRQMTVADRGTAIKLSDQLVDYARLPTRRSIYGSDIVIGTPVYGSI